MNESVLASPLAVIYLATSLLVPHPQNSRLHSKADIKKLAAAILKFGWTNPILIDDDFNVLAGHCRLEAAKRLGLEEVPTICLSHMSAAEKRAYIIADNRMNEVVGKWDRGMLALECETIKLLEPDFDLSSTGFKIDEIAIILDNAVTARNEVPPLPALQSAPVSMLGDLWWMGEHRLLCGDARDPAQFTLLMQDELAHIVIAPTPYNVPVSGHMVRRGQHREFVMASGEMSPPEFTDFLTTIFANLIRFSTDGSIHYLWMDWRHLTEMVEATAQYTERKNVICWNKQTAGLGAFYRNQHELILVMKSGKGKHQNNFKLSQNGRHRTNVWDYPGLSGFTKDRSEQLKMHPCVQPVAMIVEALKDCSRKGDIVLDCFGGSGTTMIAAEQVGRKARLMELDPLYVDVAIRRWQADTGLKAFLGDTGLSFEQVEQKGREEHD